MSKFSRLVCAFLAILTVVLALPMLQITASANDNYTHSERYMTDKFSSNGCKVNMGLDYTTVEISQYDSYISADVNVSENISEYNAIKINLQNSSSCDRIIFTYKYFDKVGSLRTRETLIDISPNTQRQDYFFYPDLSMGLVSYKLTFDSAHSGKIRIYSINAISMYESVIENELGTVSECIFDPASASINVKGTVKYDVSVKYKEAKLELFALGPSDSLEDIVENFDVEPIAKVDMSNRFSFNVSVSGFSDRVARYALFVTYFNETGILTREPLTYPRYPESLASQTFPSYKTDAFKGVNSMYFSTAADSCTASAVVDVYLNSLINTASASVPHSVYGYNVYFDRTYLEYIDLSVKNYSAEGTKVYLRFLISPGNDDIIYAPKSASNAKYRGILLDSEEASMCIYAVADFLGARYSSTNTGTVDGVIVGTRVDLANEFNYVGRMTLEDYTQNLAYVMCLFSSAWRAYNPSVELVIPLSARFCDEVILPEENMKTYSQDLLMSGVCNYFMASLSDHNKLRLMFENDATPCSVNEDGVLSVNQTSKKSLGVSDINSLESMMKKINFGECVDNSFIYYWNVDPNLQGVELSGSYVYSYLTLLNEKRVSEFIVSFAQSEINGGSDSFFQIKNIFKYIDTQLSTDVTDPVKKHFGINSWQEIVAKYGSNSIKRISILQSDLLTAPIKALKGEFTLWDFSVATSTLGWYSGVNCSSIGVSSGGDSRALVGNMSVGHGDEYGSMVYEFAYTEDICIGDYLSFDVSVKDELASSYEIKLILGGEDYVAESKQILLANSDATRFYFDTSIISSLENVKYLKISARPLSDKDDSFSLALSNMSLYSSTKNSEELEDAVINSRNELRQAQTEVQKGNTLPTKYIIVILIAVLFMAVVTIIVSRKKTFFN